MSFLALLEAREWQAVKAHIRRLIEFSVLHGAAVVMTLFVSYPVQEFLIRDGLDQALFMTPALLFFPAVVKALAAWMYGWWAVLYILPTSVVLHKFFLGNLIEWNHLAIVTIYLTAAPAVKLCLEQFGLDFETSRELHTWRSLFVIMVFSSVVTASSILVLIGDPNSILEGVLFALLFVLGDATGAMIFLLSFLVYFRLRERSVNGLVPKKRLNPSSQ